MRIPELDDVIRRNGILPRIPIPEPRISLWDAMKNYINEIYENVLNENQMFTRRGLMANLESQGFRGRETGGRYKTMDQYRNLLAKASYIKTIRRGIYEVFALIPIDLSICDARNEAYGHNQQRQNPIIHMMPTLVKIIDDGSIKKKEKKLDFIDAGEFSV